MAEKPKAKDGTLRALVREVLAMAPGYGLTDEMLCRAVRELLPVNSADDSAILTAAEWNLGKDFVSTAENEDTDEREWRITHHGLAKQSLK
ncbi:hypothetical protein [Luteolibacter marinus]|uniref:hypothetical protein n=1 Tax=Luteolibacter marinus TaxID=2776705 RepID=UPI001868194F|nr:hypothetical protein [Luteolibacter marinus]